jgi:protein-S-isoprenylcysteine O-methyltransferase Ste14
MARQLIGVVGHVALFAVMLFLPAGTIRWRAAWILLGVLFFVRALSAARLWMVQRELAVERTKLPIQRGQITADRALVTAFMATSAALIAFASADLWHLHLLPTFAPSLRVIGLVIFALGWWIVYLALSANAYAVCVVRFQEERGHQVAEGGLYRHVRHPMYAGLVLVTSGLCIWLGSPAALIAALIPVAILVVRILFEERMLRTKLTGYGEYAARVRWRLVPGVW